MDSTFTSNAPKLQTHTHIPWSLGFNNFNDNNTRWRNSYALGTLNEYHNPSSLFIFPWNEDKIIKNTCLNSSLDLYTESCPKPTLPDGTEVKKGESPKMHPSSIHVGGDRNTSTSDERANWGILVSSLVETITVLESSGSICTWARERFKASNSWTKCLKMESGTYLHYDPSCSCITPVTAIFKAQYNELFMLHFSSYQCFDCTSLTLKTM